MLSRARPPAYRFHPSTHHPLSTKLAVWQLLVAEKMLYLQAPPGSPGPLEAVVFYYSK